MRCGRTAASRRPFAFAALLPDEPPAPTAAELNTGTNTLRVTFNQPIQAGSAALAEFVVEGSLAQERHSVAGPFVVESGVTARIAMTTIGASAGTSRVSYTAVTPAIVGTNGLPAAPFTDFPLTLV